MSIWIIKPFNNSNTMQQHLQRYAVDSPLTMNLIPVILCFAVEYSIPVIIIHFFNLSMTIFTRKVNHPLKKQIFDCVGCCEPNASRIDCVKYSLLPSPVEKTV